MVLPEERATSTSCEQRAEQGERNVPGRSDGWGPGGERGDQEKLRCPSTEEAQHRAGSQGTGEGLAETTNSA